MINNLEVNFDLELSKLDQNSEEKSLITKENMNTEIFLCTPEFYRNVFIAENVSRIEIELFLTELNQSCKFKIFKYFWSNGFYITRGTKFGGDYLVYPGKPSKYHSQFIVVCFEEEKKYRFTLKDLITYARMATSVKKTMVLAYCSDIKVKDNKHTFGEDEFKMESSEINLLSINWSHL